jgi:hypothetical protein
MPFPSPGPGRYGAPWPEANTTPAGVLLLALVVVALEALVLAALVELVPALALALLLLLELLPQPAARTAAHSNPAATA